MPYIPPFVVEKILVPSFLTVFFVVGVVGLALGIGLIFHSEKVFRFFEVMNRWVSFRRAFKPMEISRESWPAVRRYRQWLAAAIIGGAGYTLYIFLNYVDVERLATIFGSKSGLPLPFLAWIARSIEWFLVLGNLIALAVGVMLWFFPDSLALMEKKSAHWISTRSMAKGAGRPHYLLDNWAAASPRIAGMLIFALAAVEVTYVGSILFR